MILLCRFLGPSGAPHVGLSSDGVRVSDLTALGVADMGDALARATELASDLTTASPPAPACLASTLRWLPPVDRQEVWAAGVTYLRSKAARMEESAFSATAYDRVYAAPRPELFFKALAAKVVGPGDAVGIRNDAHWNVPEPELALVIDAQGRIAGYTIGNDMSSRDIEGENLLYLPQAKVYDRSCALGPWIRADADEAQARTWSIELAIRRAGTVAFEGQTAAGQIKRPFGELVDYLFRCQRFPAGVVLLTGTGIVPPDSFSLEPGDAVAIRISGIGQLENTVVRV